MNLHTGAEINRDLGVFSTPDVMAMTSRLPSLIVHNNHHAAASQSQMTHYPNKNHPEVSIGSSKNILIPSRVQYQTLMPEYPDEKTNMSASKAKCAGSNISAENYRSGNELRNNLNRSIHKIQRTNQKEGKYLKKSKVLLSKDNLKLLKDMSKEKKRK